MKYRMEERLEIGRKIYTGELDRYKAAELYGISDYTARDYMRLYRKQNGLSPKSNSKEHIRPIFTELADGKDYESMTREELMLELVKARIAEARLKKGYEVKGDGTVILYDIENTK